MLGDEGINTIIELLKLFKHLNEIDLTDNGETDYDYLMECCNL